MDRKRASLCTLPEAVKYAAWALENINPRILLANIRPIFISHRDTENIREHFAIDLTTL
jgi:hypothetical protein